MFGWKARQRRRAGLETQPPEVSLDPARRARRRRRRRVALALLVTFLAVDSLWSPRRQVMVWVAGRALDVYQTLGRPITSRTTTCRFHPSCSEYSRGAFEKYGFWPGLVKTIGRIARCNPGTPPGTLDEP